MINEKIIKESLLRDNSSIEAFLIEIATGKVKRVNIIDFQFFFKKNKMPNQFKTDIISHLTGTATPIMTITNIALSTNPASIGGTSGSSLNLARKVIGSHTISDTFEISYNTTFDGTEANTKSEKVTAVTDKRHITVSNTGFGSFRKDDGIKLKLFNLGNSVRENQIKTVTGNNIEFYNDFEVLPAINDPIDQLIYRVELLYNTGLTFDLGKCISIATLKTPKTSASILKIKHKISVFSS